MDVWETFITNGCVNKFFVPKDPYMLRNTCPETGEFSGCCNESGIGGAALRPKKGEQGKSRSEKKPLQVVDIDRKVEEEE